MTATTVKKFRHGSAISGLQAADTSLISLQGNGNHDGFSFGVSAAGLAVLRRQGSGHIQHALTTPICEQALCYFAQAFKFVSRGHPMGSVSYGSLVNVLDSHPNSRCLQASISAASLAALSTRRNSRSLHLQAQEYYSVALRSVNSAIQDPTNVHSDDTIAAVLCMAFYESLTSMDLAGFYHHIQGAVTIAKVRGKSMVRNAMALQFLKLIMTELVSTACTPDPGFGFGSRGKT